MLGQHPREPRPCIVVGQQAVRHLDPLRPESEFGRVACRGLMEPVLRENGGTNRGGAWGREGQECARVLRPSAEGLIVAVLRGRGRSPTATRERQRVGPHLTQSRCLECPSAWRTSPDAQARTTLRMPLPTCVPHVATPRRGLVSSISQLRAKPSNPGDASGYTYSGLLRCCRPMGPVERGVDL